MVEFRKIRRLHGRMGWRKYVGRNRYGHESFESKETCVLTHSKHYKWTKWTFQSKELLIIYNKQIAKDFERRVGKDICML